MFPSTLLAHFRFGRISTRNAWYWPWAKKAVASADEKKSSKNTFVGVTMPVCVKISSIQHSNNREMQNINLQLEISIPRDNEKSNQDGEWTTQMEEKLEPLKKQNYEMECFICGQPRSVKNLITHTKKCTEYNHFWLGKAKICPELAKALKINENDPLSEEERKWHDSNMKMKLREKYPEPISGPEYAVYLIFDENEEERSIQSWRYVGVCQTSKLQAIIRTHQSRYRTQNGNWDLNLKAAVFMDGLSGDDAYFVEYILMQMRDFPKNTNGNAQFELVKVLHRQPTKCSEWRKLLLPLLIEQIRHGEFIELTSLRRKESVQA